MGLFDRFSRHEDYYEPMEKRLTPSEREILEKSMPKGRSMTSPTVNALDVNTSDSTSIAKGSVLEIKDQLRDASQHIIVQSIIRTRINQVQQFARPSRYSSDGVGFKIVPRRPPKDGKLSAQQENKIRKYEDFIMNSGVEWVPQRGNAFKSFIASFIFNYFVYDQINVELIRGKDHKLNHYNFVDAGTIVLDKLPLHADEPRHFLQYADNLSKPVHFSEDNMTFVSYSNYSNIKRRGYGFSNLEATLNHLQYQSNTEQFNARFFSQGGTTRGLLLIDTGATAAQNTAALNSLRRQWQASFQGINGAWKIPVISASDAKFVNMTQSSKDMEFENFLTYLINIICANFQIQPDEINFPNRGGATSKGQGNSINEGSTQKAKFQQSREKGLRTLLDNIEDFINEYILRLVDKDYYFRFTLGETKDALEQEQLRGQKLKNGMTINEARKEMGLDPLQGQIGTLPGDPSTVVQFMQLFASQDESFQFNQQHKNDNDPKKAENGQPNRAMPASAIDGKTKSPTKDQPAPNNDPSTNDDPDNG